MKLITKRRNEKDPQGNNWCFLLDISTVDSSSPNFHCASFTLEITKNTTVNPAQRTVTTSRNSKRYIKP